MIRLPIRDGDWECPMQFELVLREKFDSDSLFKEIAKMQVWLEANPHRKPTIKGVRRFMANWLNKSGCFKPQLATQVSNSIVQSEWQRTDKDLETGRAAMQQIRARLGR